MKKLVRDNIPTILTKNNLIYKTKTLIDDRQFMQALQEKLVEEMEEFIEASNRQVDHEAKEELADILEVIDALCKFKKYDRNEIEAYRLKKKSEKGGFDKRIFLILED